MHVAHRAIDPCRRHIEHLDTARGVDAADRAADDLRVVRALHGSIRPGVELEAVLDEQIRAPEPKHEAWADLDVVRVLAATGQGLDVDLVAADLLHERLEVRDRRHDAELVGAVSARGQEAERHGSANEGGRSVAHHFIAVTRALTL